MLTRILRQFAFVRDLELALQRERDRTAIAERHLESELTFWKQKDAAHEAEIQRLNRALQEKVEKVADTMSIHAIGKRFFSKAEPPPIPPEGQGLHMPPVGRQFARDVQRQKIGEVRDELKQLWDNLPVVNGN